MKSALTSINKPHTDNIFTEDETRRKTVEWRTKPLPKCKHYVYETKNKGGCGKVIGEMEIVEVIKYADVSAIPLTIILCGKVGARELDLYSKGRPLYANVIAGAKRYNKPKELGEFWHPCPNKSAEKIFDCIAGIKSCKYKTKELPFQCTARISRPPQSWYYIDQ